VSDLPKDAQDYPGKQISRRIMIWPHL